MVVGGSGGVEHFELFRGRCEVGWFHVVAYEGIAEAADLFGDAVGTAGGAFEEVDRGSAAVVHSAEVGAHAEGPVHGAGGNAEDAFQFVHEVERIAGRAVQFVHEREDRDAAAAADFEELAGLAFDAFACVDDHDGGVDGGENAVGILREVAVAGRVEKIDDAAVVFELEDGGADGDAALLFHFHPVRRGGALVFAGGD